MHSHDQLSKSESHNNNHRFSKRSIRAYVSSAIAWPCAFGDWLDCPSTITHTHTHTHHHGHTTYLWDLVFADTHTQSILSTFTCISERDGVKYSAIALARTLIAWPGYTTGRADPHRIEASTSRRGSRHCVVWSCCAREKERERERNFLVLFCSKGEGFIKLSTFGVGAEFPIL